MIQWRDLFHMPERSIYSLVGDATPLWIYTQLLSMRMAASSYYPKPATVQIEIKRIARGFPRCEMPHRRLLIRRAP